jgi:hypothetical protein
MAEITISRERVLSTHRDNPEFQSILESLFGRKIFQKITDRIDSFEAACEELGIDPFETRFMAGDTDDIAYQKLKVIVRALCEAWVASYRNHSQKKWFPVFVFDTEGGFRFHYAAWYSHHAIGGGRSRRLVLPNEELTIYCATKFLDLWKDLIS